MKNPKGIFFRWIEELAGYHMKIVHKKGKENIAADSLSRTPEHLPEPTKEEEQEQTHEYVLSLKRGFRRRFSNHRAQFLRTLREPLKEILSNETVKREQWTDPVLRMVRKWKISGKPEKKDLFRASRTLRTYYKMLDHIILDPETKILYTKYRLNVVNRCHNQILLPEHNETLHERVFYYCHTSKFSAH